MQSFYMDIRIIHLNSNLLKRFILYIPLIQDTHIHSIIKRLYLIDYFMLKL